MRAIFCGRGQYFAMLENGSYRTMIVQADGRNAALQEQFCAGPKHCELLTQVQEIGPLCQSHSTYRKLRSVAFLEIFAERLKLWTELVAQHCDLWRHEAGGTEGRVTSGLLLGINTCWN